MQTNHSVSISEFANMHLKKKKKIKGYQNGVASSNDYPVFIFSFYQCAIILAFG